MGKGARRLGGEAMARGIGKRFVVWHEWKTKGGVVRRPVGIIEDEDPVRARFKVMWTLLIKEKGSVLTPTGSHNWTLTSVECETPTVVKAALAIRRF